MSKHFEVLTCSAICLPAAQPFLEAQLNLAALCIGLALTLGGLKRG